MIRRESYLKKLQGYQDKNLIKVNIGIKRGGKSTLLEMFRKDLQERCQAPNLHFSQKPSADK